MIRGFRVGAERETVKSCCPGKLPGTDSRQLGVLFTGCLISPRQGAAAVGRKGGKAADSLTPASGRRKRRGSKSQGGPGSVRCGRKVTSAWVCCI